MMTVQVLEVDDGDGDEGLEEGWFDVRGCSDAGYPETEEARKMIRILLILDGEDDAVVLENDHDEEQDDE